MVTANTAPQIDTFLCVHTRDVGYLLEVVLRSYQVNFQPKGKLFLVSNDLPPLRDFIARIGLDKDTTLFNDGEWLTQREMELPGWYRQQIIKLRAHQFCSTPNFCNLGADTVLLRNIGFDDLVQNTLPILHYTKHLLPDAHYRYERKRVKHVADILRVQPTTALKYVDFINDLFCFNRDMLVSLNSYLEQLYGADSFYELLKTLRSVEADQNKFGEWTLYSVYILDQLKAAVSLRNTRPEFLYQVHSRRQLPFFQFNTKVAHFVSKDFDVEIIKRRICERGLELANYL